jgi:hypothetical protein
MDVTPLFLTAAEVYRRHRLSSGSVDSFLKLPPRPALQIQVEALCRAVKSTAAAALRLHRLSRRRALYDDLASDVNSATQVIKAQLLHINSSLEQLHIATKSLSGLDPRTTPAFVSSPRAHWLIIYETLKEHALDLARVFHDALATRAKNLHEHSQRRRAYDRSGFVPNVLPDAALFAPLDSPSPGSNFSHYTTDSPRDTGHRVVMHEGLRPRRLQPASTSQAGASDSSHSNSHGTGSKQADPNQSWKGGAYTQQQSSSGSSNNAFMHSASSGAYKFTAQQVAQYHTVSARAEEQHQVEATVVEIGKLKSMRAYVLCVYVCVYVLVGGSLLIGPHWCLFLQVTCSLAWRPW